jgi:cytochrome c biogenesis protein CcmG/thiol:disulfide interchange protein DsbE
MPRGASQALARMRRAVRQHKLASAVTAAGAAFAVAAVTVAATSGTTGAARPAHHSDPRAPAFTLAALDGQAGHAGQVSLAAYAGKPVIVNFFASWCVPCRKETPLMARFYRSAHGSIHVIGVDTNDSETAAVRFTHSAGVTYPVAFDPAARTAGSFGVVAIPQTFFLNAEHRIVDRIYGAVTDAQLARGVALMGASTTPAASHPPSGTAQTGS